MGSGQGGGDKWTKIPACANNKLWALGWGAQNELKLARVQNNKLLAPGYGAPNGQKFASACEV